MAAGTSESVRSWAWWLTVVAGVALVVIRLATYIDIATEDGVDIGFLAAATWWATYLVGIGLFAMGAAGTNGGRRPETGDWVLLAIGLLVLIVIQPGPALSPQSVFGSMFG